MSEYIIKHEGFVFMYVSNNSPVNVYFDDVALRHSATNIIQYNEYYPFGLQTASSWTRENASNRYVYNGGNELNETSGWYETFFREYDAALGRFMQVDPLAGSFASHSPYHYAYNNPLLYNDVMGDSSERFGPFSGNHWSDKYVTAESFLMRAPHMTNGGTWTKGEGQTIFQSSQEASAYARDRFVYYWNPYGGQEIMREVWLLLVGPEGRTKFADHYFPGAWELLEDAIFFDDPTKAYNYMYDNSFPDGERIRENMAYIVDGGVIVLPTEGYEYNRMQKTNRYRRNSPNNGHKYLLPWDVRYGNMYVKVNNREHKVHASIHTHPNSGSATFGDMHGRNQSGDWQGLLMDAYKVMFVIGADGVGRGWKDDGGGLHYRYEGTLDSLLNGTLILRP